MLALLLLAATPWGARRFGGTAARLVAWSAAHPAAIAAVATALLAAGALTVYMVYPLSMDEYAPVFQARIFAAGHLTGRWPPQLAAWLLPPRLARSFFVVGADGEVISGYWPGLALLLAPLSRLHAEWLLQPLLAGAALLLMAAIARRLLPGRADAAGWVALLALASPAFTVNGLSFYSMTAQLCAFLLYAWLLCERGRGRAFLAGVVGSLALVLANPVPHLLAGAPWVVRTAWRRERRRDLLPLFLGYLPLTLVVGVGWHLLRSRLAAGSPLPQPPWVLPFRWPSGEMLWLRLLELLALAGWAVPALPILAVLGYRRIRRSGGEGARELAGLLGASAVTLLAGYFFLSFGQGHGWGYRYFHPAWATLPLFGAAMAAGEPEGGERTARWAPAIGWLALSSLLLANGLRAVEVHRFVERSRAELPAPPPQRPLVCFAAIRRVSMDDTVRNDPFLRDDLLLLVSHGKEDASLRATLFPRASPVSRHPDLSCWSVGDDALASLRHPG